MVNFIKNSHPNETGVIYRTGRDKCEKLAQQLRQKGLSARHYHAKMDPADKEMVQAQWQSGQCHIIVATIAFGMGIDKSDVRFVIHYESAEKHGWVLPETGRAGRDGLPADCVLYYAYRDLQTILKMIKDTKDPNVTKDSKERQEQAVRAVVRYCENDSVCRRIQLLQHFGEKFDPKGCRGRCNNCANEKSLVAQDVTKEAKSVLTLVQSFEHGHENVTVDQCRAVFRGANAASVREKRHDQHPAYGSGRDMPKELAEMLFNRLLFLDALVEVSTQTTSKWHQQYVKLGPRAHEFLTENRSLELKFLPKTPKAGGKAKATKGRRNATANPRQEPERSQPLFDDDDEMEDIEPGWSPKKPVQESPRAREVVEIISDSEDEASRPSPDKLYQKLVSHRQAIMERTSLSQADILDDETLQYLSAVNPRDFQAFKRGMLHISRDKFNSLEEANRAVDAQFAAHGQGFLNLCLGLKVTTATADPKEWRAQFDYRAQPAASTSKIPAGVRAFKFK